MALLRLVWIKCAYQIMSLPMVRLLTIICLSACFYCSVLFFISQWLLSFVILWKVVTLSLYWSFTGCWQLLFRWSLYSLIPWRSCRQLIMLISFTWAIACAISTFSYLFTIYHNCIIICWFIILFINLLTSPLNYILV